MTEYWKSQENWFCKYCKCWVSDNPVSRQIHENGVKHKQMVEDKLSEIRRKQVTDAKSAKDESHWLKKMEEAALRDYKKKDIAENRDFTAKLYNNEDLPDVEEKYEAIRKSNEVGPRLPGQPEHKKMKFEQMLQAGTEKALANSEATSLNPVKATDSGTKWHKPAPPKFWYEAKSDDGNTYYWNVNTKESRWEPPLSGYVSIADQEKLESKKEVKIAKKAQMISEQQKKFKKKEPLPEPEPVKTDRYGGSGWTTVAAPVIQAPQDLGLPQKRENRLEPVIKPDKEKTYTFKEKTFDSLSAEDVQGAKPTITFRKRKNNAVRERTGDD